MHNAMIANADLALKLGIFSPEDKKAETAASGPVSAVTHKAPYVLSVGSEVNGNAGRVFLSLSQLVVFAVC